MRTLLSLVAFLIVAIYLIVWSCCYVVDAREQAVVLQFGNPVHARTEPGLYFKIPFVQNVLFIPRTRLFWGGEADDLLPDLPTKDGKKVELTPFAVWRITDPIAFARVLRTQQTAEERIKQFTRNAVRDIITTYDLIELVRSSDRKLTYTFGTDLLADAGNAKPAEIAIEPPPEVNATVRVGRPQILKRIKEEARARITSGQEESRGIEIVDIGLSRVDFVETVRRAAFERLRKFMESIAAYYTNDGERKKQEIINRTMAEVSRIQGEGQQRSNETRGTIDAEIIRRYAIAINETGDFFVFMRQLKAAKTCLTGDTRIILTTDSPLLQVLKQIPTGFNRSDPRPIPAATPAPVSDPSP
ncbi:protease modulator HflC [bacterium]|nr:protease modulator HflC [bacterium]